MALDQLGEFTLVAVEHCDNIVMRHTGEIAVAAEAVVSYEMPEAGKPGDEHERWFCCNG